MSFSFFKTNSNAAPYSIVFGLDNYLWVTKNKANKMGIIVLTWEHLIFNAFWRGQILRFASHYPLQNKDLCGRSWRLPSQLDNSQKEILAQEGMRGQAESSRNPQGA
jgi:hypothetical protein